MTFPHLRDYPWRPGPVYDLGDVDLLTADDVDDLVPIEAAARRRWAHHLALEATVYGLPLVWQYVQLHAQALDPSSDRYTGFNRFRHDARLARPDYAPFRTPNADTLYSNAWLDLRDGPVEIVVPEMGDRYFTVHLLDAHSNATNLSTRTIGGGGGRFLLHAASTPADRAGPESSVRPVRVATPWTWVLLRVQVRSTDDLEEARTLQNQFLLRPRHNGVPRPFDRVAVPGQAEALDAPTFFRVLDQVLRVNGHPRQEDALVRRFRSLGLCGPLRVTPHDWDRPLRAGIEAGWAEGMGLIRDARRLRGHGTGSGWRTLSSGAYGFNYLHRAATNYVGLGATIRTENAAFTTFVDGQGDGLDGRRGTYQLTLAPPPQVDAFWSLSAYDLETRQLVENPIDRHSIGSHTGGLSAMDGSVTVDLRTDPPPPDRHGRWLPVPPGPFYLVLRAYLPQGPVVDGTWEPASVRRMQE